MRRSGGVPQAVRVLSSLLYLGAALGPVHAADPQTAVVPVDAEKSWTLGMTRFRSVNLSRENEYLAASLPLLIREKIAHVTTHRFGREELAAHRQAIINAALKKEIANLLAEQKKRDDSLFSESKDFQKKKIRDDYVAASALIRARINFLRALDPDRIVMEPEKPLTLKDNNGLLYPPPPFSALRYADEIAVQAVLWGTVEEIRGYLYCELYLFDRVQEKNIFSFREAGEPQEIFSSLERSLPALLTTLWGRPWSELLVDVDPSFSFIKVNGKLLGMGTVESRALEPGEIRLEIEAPGYKPLKETITLNQGERVVKEYHLTKTDEAFLLIESIPPEANVYFNALWIGRTPLLAELPALTTRLILRKDGFHNTFYRLEPSSPDRLLFPLVKEALDFEAFQKSTRTRFYTSLAAFLLSLPFPVFCYSLAWENAFAQRPGPTEFFQASYYWTAFISGALIVNMLFDLFLYLRSRDKPIG
jgi:hypothetical protein